MRLLNFENWCNGEPTKIGHHFSSKSIYKLMWSKNVKKKMWSLTGIFQSKKIEKYSDDFWHRKLTLKVKFWHFLTPPHYTIYQNSIISFDYSWFLGKNISNFVFPNYLKLHNLYCHNLHMINCVLLSTSSLNCAFHL